MANQEMDFGLRIYALFQSSAEELAHLQRTWQGCPRWPVLQRRIELGLEPDLTARPWIRRYSLQRCLEEASQALHWRTQQVWLVLALDGYAEGAIHDLIRLLSLSSDLVAEAVAWALSRLGRSILPDLGHRWGYASPRLRDRICQCLCYLGPAARGAENWLQDHPTPWSRALCYRMKQHGWRPLLAWRISPIWLDDSSLEALAQLAFSHQPEDRLYAIQALSAWGSDSEARTSLLRALAGDQDVDVSLAAVSVMEALDLDPGLAPLFSPDPFVQRRALKSYLDRHYPEGPDWVEASQDPVAFQEVMLHLLHRSNLGWRLRIFHHLAHKGVANPTQASQMAHWLTDPNPEVRMACLLAYDRLEGASPPLTPLLQDPQDSLCRLAARALVRRQEPGPLLLHLERMVILREVAEEYLMLMCLDQVTIQHLEQLQRLSQSPEEELASLARTVLSQLDLERVRWESFDRFNDCQRKTALGLVHLHNRLPDDLPSHLVQATLNHPDVWQLWLAYSSATEVCAGLRSRLMGPNPDKVIGLVQRLGREGWELLLELLRGPASLALLAVQQLRNWVSEQEQARQWLIQHGPQLLQQVSEPSVEGALASAVAQSLLHEFSPPEEGKRAWAWELATRPSSTITAMRYLQRSGESLDGVLEKALLHPLPEVRMLAVTLLRRGRTECATVFRRHPPDPNPRVRLRVLGLLHEQGGLEPAELAELSGLAQLDGLHLEVQGLLSRIQYEKP